MVNKEISTLILNEIQHCRKTIEALLLKTDFSEFEKLKIWERSLQKELDDVQIKLRNFNVFEVSLNNILNNEILLTDKALHKLKIKDILEQIAELENGDYENFKNIPNLLYNILDDIATNEEVKVYLNETKMTVPKIKTGINKLFEALLNNTAITAAPKDENQRRLEYNKYLKGYKVIALLLKESTIEPILKLGNLIMISEVSYYCASGWKDTLLELMNKFSSDIKEKYKDTITLDYEKDPLKKILNEIFFNARKCITKDLSYKYIDDNNISVMERPHYIDIFKQVFNEVYNLNLPYFETNDSYLGIDAINNIKESFIDSLKNTYINDLIYDKACELFYDRLKEEPDFYIGTKIKPKFWGDIMEWSKKYYHNNNLDKKFSSPVEFMSEYVTGNDTNKNPIRYIAIKEIMKDCGFIEEIIKDDRYGNEYYRKQPEICMTRLKRGIMDIKSEKELKQLNSNLNSIHSRGIDIKKLIEFIKDEGKFELMKYINLDHFDITIDEVDENELTVLMKICQTTNDTNSIKHLLMDAKADINHQNKYGWTALMYAAKYNKNINICKFLIENGANVKLYDHHQWTALMLACYYSEDIELVKLLVKAGSNINQQTSKGWTALMCYTASYRFNAVRNSKVPEIPKYLIENGADINLTDKENRNALMLACHYSKDMELVKLLINEKTNINQQDKNGYTALMYAIENKNKNKPNQIKNSCDLARYLIENKGAEVKNLKNINQENTLILACRYTRDIELVKLLLRKGSDLNQQDNYGYTALMYSIEEEEDKDDLSICNDNTNSSSNVTVNVKKGNVISNTSINSKSDISKLLIESGANVNLINNNFWNALMFACRYSNDLELIKLLMNERSNISQRDIYGWSAIKIARNYNSNSDILKYLIREKSVKNISNKPIKSIVYKILK